MDKLSSCACCFSCFRNKRTNSIKDPNSLPTQQVEEPNPNPKPKLPDAIEKPKKAAGDASSNNIDTDKVDTGEINAKHFTFRELASATKNFRHQYLLGEGGFGRVYKGTLKNGQVVAVKQLDRNGQQEQKEFLVEVLMVSLLHHENLVDLVGYCADGDQRLLVYEFVPGGSLDQYILDVGEDKTPLDWYTRIKIAYGAAQGLEYLHDKANPPVIYRDMKSSNILLDNDLNPKLSDFGLANLGPQGNNMPPASRIMGTYGYSAPEYTSTGQVTLESDVFSYGVVLLEILTGRRAIDTTKPINEQNLVSWAQPFFKDPKKFPEMADPLLEGKFPERSLNQAVAIAAMCLQEEPAARPLMSDVVTALSFLSVKEPIPTPQPIPEPAPPADPAPQSSDSESSDNDKYKARQVTFSIGTSRKSSKKRSSTIRRSESSSSDGSFSRYHSTKIDIDTSDSESELFDDESVMSGRISSRNSRTGSTSKRSNQSRHRESEYDGSVQSG